MKLISTVVACLAISCAVQAQTTTTAKRKVRKNAIGGTIMDARHKPVPKVQAFVYFGDSAVNASGYTDASGYFETNSVMPGTYDLRIVYPNANRLIINGVTVKGLKVSRVSIATDMPTTDSTVSYLDVIEK